MAITVLTQRSKISMSSNLFKRLFVRLCPHRFSWPHSGVHGQDYQVCLICGTAFAIRLEQHASHGPPRCLARFAC